MPNAQPQPPPWTPQPAPPAPSPVPQPAAQRVSQADRDRVVDLLKGAYVDGRLEVEEFQERAQTALAARTPTDLAAVLADVTPRAVPRPWPAAGTAAAPAAADDRGVAALTHLLGLFTSFIGPLVVALACRRGFARDQAVEALNFQLTIALVAVALVIPTVVTFGVAGVLYAPLGVADLVLSVVAAVSAAGGHRYRYPGTLRLAT